MREEMRAVAEEVGLKRYSPSLLADLAHVRAGGEILSPSIWRLEVERKVTEEIRPERDGSYRLPNGGATHSFGEAVSAKVEKAVKYHTAVSDFVREVDWSGIPGTTPLEQGANLLKLLAAKKGGAPGSGDGETLPVFLEEAGDTVARELAEVLDEVEDLDKEDRELLEDKDDESKSSGSGQGGLSAMQIAEDFLSDRGKREMVRISRSLDELSRMKVSRESKFTPDPEGDDVRSRPIRNLGELTRVSKPSWAIYQKSRTLFWYQAVTKQLSVRERGIRSERKQLLYLIIDCSGSMKEGQRVAKACGVLMNRLKAVLRGDAVLYWRLFDTKLREEHFVSTPEEGKAAMRELAAGNFSGGGTAIDACSRQALARIEEIAREGKIHRPELVVVSDGDDTVRLTPEDLGQTRLHAFLAECSNPPLTALAGKSGGVGIDRL
ncbi:MAG: hypothetical protein HY336_02070 [Candidatus Doudnabacteria bacterium]|nr:hypothetical protein [Candidatus Doudnabacteria bacterium]